MTTFLKQLFCGAALLACAGTQAAVVNGDFETGDLSGWTLDGAPEWTLVAPGLQHGGDYSAFFGQIGAASSITQSLSTVAGQTYELTFWLSNLGGGLGNDSVFTTAEVLVGGNSVWSTSDKTATDYALYTLQFTASGSSTDLVFSMRQDESYWLLDDVNVSAVPEPATVLMLVGGLGLVALQRRRNRAI